MATCVVDVVGRDVAAPADDRADTSNFKATCVIVGLSPYTFATMTGADEPPGRVGEKASCIAVVDAHGMDGCELRESFEVSRD